MEILSNNKQDWGYCRVDSIKVIGDENFPQTDLMPSMEFHRPDDDNVHDQTVFSVRLPKPVEPGQTIRLEKTENSDGTATHRFFQQSVHDFAWTASPHFLKYVEAYEFTPGKSTEVTLLLQPYHRNLKDRYMNAVKNALKYCSLWYGDYPYTTITCVDAAYNSRSGGMEYPALFTGGTYFLSLEGTGRPEGITIHEFSHGYFYRLVAKNEFEDAWMDEGFASFLDSEVYEAAYGETLFSRSYFGIPFVFKEVRIPIESSGISRHRQTYDMDIMQNFTWHFMNSSSYGANSYAKAELMLRTLKRFMGKELFADMIKAYSMRHWFKHPRPRDFYRTVSEFAGRTNNSLTMKPARLGGAQMGRQMAGLVPACPGIFLDFRRLV